MQMRVAVVEISREICSRCKGPEAGPSVGGPVRIPEWLEQSE